MQKRLGYCRIPKVGTTSLSLFFIKAIADQPDQYLDSVGYNTSISLNAQKNGVRGVKGINTRLESQKLMKRFGGGTEVKWNDLTTMMAVRWRKLCEIVHHFYKLFKLKYLNNFLMGTN